MANAYTLKTCFQGTESTQKVPTYESIRGTSKTISDA